MAVTQCPECGYRLSGGEAVCPRCLTALGRTARSSAARSGDTASAARKTPTALEPAAELPVSLPTESRRPPLGPESPATSRRTRQSHAAAPVSLLYIGLSVVLGALTLIAFVVLWTSIARRDAAYYLAQADGYRRNGQYEHALVAYLRVLERDPVSAAAKNGSGWCYLEMDRPAEAIPHFRQAVDADGQMIEARRGLGIAYSRVGMYPEAEGSLKPAWEKRDLEAGTWLGYVYVQEQRYDEAINLLRDVIAAQPRNALALEYFGHSLYAMKRYDEALEPLRAAVEQNPNSATAREALGLVGYALGRCDWALEQFNALIAANPQRADWYSYAGQCMLQEGQSQEAAAYLNHALLLGQADPILRDTHLALAQAYLEQTLYDEAVVLFQRALILDPGSAPAMAGLGLAYAAQEQCDVAKELFEQALTIDPYLKTAQQGLEQCP